MQVIGKMANIMVLAPFCGLMVVCIKENGEIVEKMDKESLLGVKALFMKVNGLRENIMDVVNFKHMKARFMLGLLRMGSIQADRNSCVDHFKLYLEMLV